MKNTFIHYINLKALVALLFCFCGLFYSNKTSAGNVTIVKPSLTIDACYWPSDYFGLGDISMTEPNGDKGAFNTGTAITLILTAPAGFEFKPGAGSVSYTGSRNISNASVDVLATTITVTYDVGGTDKVDKMTIADIEVRGISPGSPTTGNITRLTVGTTGGTGVITGAGTNQTFAALTSTLTASTVNLAPASLLNMCLNVPQTLPNITLIESNCPSDFLPGAGLTLILTAPAGFTFVGGGSAIFSAGNDITSASTSFTATTLTVTYTVANNAIPGSDALTLSGIQVQSAAATGSSNITVTSGTGIAKINGISVGSIFATVSSAASTATLTTFGGTSCMTIAGAYSTLSDLVITESCPADISTTGSRTFTITLPATFEFDLGGANFGVTFTAGRNITSAALVRTSATVITITFNNTGTALLDEFKVTGVRVRAAVGTPNLTSGNFTSGGTMTIAGVPAATVLGTVTANSAAGTITWSGTTNTTWSTNTNWVGNVVPGPCTDVIIPNVANKPIVTAATAVNSVTIQTGAKLTANAALTINSAFTIQGTGIYIHNNLGAPGTTIFAGTESISTTSTIEVLNWISASEPFAKYISGSLGNLNFAPSSLTTVWSQDGYMSGAQKVFGKLTIYRTQIQMDGGAGASTQLILGDLETSSTSPTTLGTVVTPLNASFIARGGAAPAGGFTFTSGNVTFGGVKTAYTCILFQCPAPTLTWNLTGNLTIAQDFGVSRGSAGNAVDIDMNISGNFVLNNGGISISETSYLGSDVTITVGGTTTFNVPVATGNWVNFIDGGTGNLNFTTGAWTILRSPAAPYNSLMQFINFGQTRPTGSVTVNVTNDMSFTGTLWIQQNYLVNETTNTSPCSLTVGGTIFIDNSAGAGTSYSRCIFANHSGTLNIQASNIDITGSSLTYINIFGQYNLASTAAVTIATTNDFIMRDARAAMRLSHSQGQFNLNIGRDFSMLNGYYMGMYNTSYLQTQGSNVTVGRNFLWEQGQYVHYYACNSGTGAAQKAANLTVTGNFTLNCKVDGDQWWFLGLAALTATPTTYYNTLTHNFTVGGNFASTIGTAACDVAHVSSNSRGLETVNITGSMTINAGDIRFNFADAPAANTSYGHNIGFTLGGNMLVTAGTTYLCAEKGNLTATLNGNVSISGGDLFMKAGSGNYSSGGMTIATTDNVGTVNIAGTYTQTGGKFILNANTAVANTAVVTVTVNGNFSLTGGVLNFDRRTANTSTHVLNILGSSYTFGGTGVINRAADPGTSTASTLATFGELYFARAGTTTYNNSAAAAAGHFIQNVKMFVNAGTTVDASGSTFNFQQSSNSIQNNISGTNAKWAVNIDGILKMGTTKMSCQGGSVTAYYSGLQLNSGGVLQTANINGFYNGVNTSATLEPQVFSGNATFNVDFKLDALSTVEYNGTADQVVTGKFPNVAGNAVADVVTGTTAQYKYGKLKINNSASPATNRCYLAASNVFVRTLLDLTLGELALGTNANPVGTGYTLTVENGANTAITSTASSYLASEMNAAVNTAVLDWQNIGTSTTTYTIPFGRYTTAIKKIPVTIAKGAGDNFTSLKTSTRRSVSNNTPWAGASNVSAVANMVDVAASVTDGSACCVIDRWWDFTINNAVAMTTLTGTATLSFTYLGEENTMGAPASATAEIGVQHWNGSLNKWDDGNGNTNAATGTGVGGNTGSGTTYNVGASGFKLFSPYILVAKAFPLPIELVKFEGDCDNKNVILKWTTASEKNNKVFYIEKSLDGENFTTIGSMDGAGNSTSLINYSFEDKNANGATVYYRLKQVDFDGKSENSAVISVRACGIGKGSLLLAPNPVNNNLILSVQTQNKQFASYEIYDAVGKLVAVHKIELEEGINKIQFDSSKLSDGIYFLNLNLENETINSKFIKQTN